MEIDTNFGRISISEPVADEEKWVTFPSESAEFNKAGFFIKKFKEDFPEYSLLGKEDKDKLKFLTELCARMPITRKWFSSVSLKYSNNSQLPLYFKDAVTPEVFMDVQGKITNMKDELASVIKERNDLAAKYTADLELLNTKEKEIIKKNLGHDNIMKILFMKTEALPFSIQMKIQSYMPSGSDIEVADSRRRLAREYLAKFKVELLKMNKEKPDLDVDILLSEIQLK